jgi:hypothetical protein
LLLQASTGELQEDLEAAQKEVEQLREQLRLAEGMGASPESNGSPGAEVKKVLKLNGDAISKSPFCPSLNGACYSRYLGKFWGYLVEFWGKPVNILGEALSNFGETLGSTLSCI